MLATHFERILLPLFKSWLLFRAEIFFLSERYSWSLKAHKYASVKEKDIAVEGCSSDKIKFSRLFFSEKITSYFNLI